MAVFLSVFLAFVLLTEAARSRKDSSSQNSFRRAASGFYQTLSNIFGEENIRALYKVRIRSCDIFMQFKNVVLFAGALVVSGCVSKPIELPS